MLTKTISKQVIINVMQIQQEMKFMKCNGFIIRRIDDQIRIEMLSKRHSSPFI